ncbi:hypothetical protein [Muricoccus radiodurans]|uniref:hypothetical protein n=1 Tax=Muricoccus radiodurans TaxID=2231721 RepID=UPI003CECCE7B
MRRAILTLALTAAVASPALAQSRPQNLQPTRDVAVTYRMVGPQAGAPGTPGELGIAVLAAEGRMRVDLPPMAPGMVMWGLTDMRTGQTSVVMESMRMVMPNAAGADVAKALRMAEGARMTRTGNATYAGQACTNWRFENGNDRGTACLTDDGVMLRAANDAGQGMEATRVEYARQDPARFRVPEGYRTMSMEDMMRSMGGPGGAGGLPPSQPRR